MVSRTEYEMILEKPPKMHLGVLTNNTRDFLNLCREPSMTLKVSNSFSIFQLVTILGNGSNLSPMFQISTCP